MALPDSMPGQSFAMEQSADRGIALLSGPRLGEPVLAAHDARPAYDRAEAQRTSSGDRGGSSLANRS
jgi:hypothetical protein